MNLNNIGTLLKLGNIMHVNNAYVEEVSASDSATGFIIISFIDSSANGTHPLNNLRLNISRRTAIINLTGKNSSLYNIQKGMLVNVFFSSKMTRSIPPQSNAFLILVCNGQPDFANITTAKVISVNTGKHSFLAGDINHVRQQTLFIVTKDTVIRNRFGNPMVLSNLRPGQMVRIVHANFQTASIPPQTTAFYVQLL